jgi:hypothetical protein
MSFLDFVKFSYSFIILIAALLVASVSCRPENLSPDPAALPSFSSDTITFDTVFTTIGSSTLSLKVYNRSRRPLLIRSISLAGGSSSFFRLNIDGVATHSQMNTEIPPDDSLFIFVAVTIDPANQNNPVVIMDSIVFVTNGTVQDVKLLAYGQDIHLINHEILETQTWTQGKPYLIYNSMAVDTGHTLTIEEGVQIFFHKNSSMIIWGRLLVQGTAEQPVIFRNDRLEEFYSIVSGQWGTIYIDPISTGNRIDHAVIRNAISGIQIGFPSDGHVPELVLSNTLIENVSYAGIYAFGADLLCYNSIIANSAGPAIALLRGGRYRFYHSTVSNRGVFGPSRQGSSILISNLFSYQNVVYSGDLEQADFMNCIIYGTYPHELQFVRSPSRLFNYSFNRCLLKASEDSIAADDEGHFIRCSLNQDPAFINDMDRYHLDFNLDTLSPAHDSADFSLIVTHPFLETDMKGKSRIEEAKPDLGALERIEE